MPSASLLQWQNDRMLRLRDIDAQCAVALAAIPLNPRLVEEDLEASLNLEVEGHRGHPARPSTSRGRERVDVNQDGPAGPEWVSY